MNPFNWFAAKPKILPPKMLKFDAHDFAKVIKSGYGVRYTIYHEPGNERGVRVLPVAQVAQQPAVKQFTHVCFSQFLGELNSQVSKRKRIKDKAKKPPIANRLFYPVELHIPKETAIKWIEYCKRMKFLPPYVMPEHLDTGFVLKFGSTKDSCVPPSLIYVYLSALRNMEEHADLPRLFVILVEKYKLDPYAAIVLATKFAIGANSHHFVDWQSGGVQWAYNSNPSIEATKIPVRLIVSLRRFVCNPKQYDERLCCSGASYQAFEHISKAGGALPPYMVPACLLDNTNIINAIYGNTDEEVKQHMAKFEAETKTAIKDIK